MKFVLRDAMHEMEGTVEARGRAAFPGLDVVSWGSPGPATGRPPPEPGAVTRGADDRECAWLREVAIPRVSRVTCGDVSREP